mmetsp:Transcript_7613/g.19217  ORF Transcript_7613/g.19217 Transcript_7613/m.19217 type:complete len:217 (+) Transcript_7613:112-762(+)
MHDFTFCEDGILWNATLCIREFLSTRLRAELRGKTVLELGAGLGLLGLGVSDLGANVVITAMPSEMDALKKRVELHLAERSSKEGGPGNVETFPLLWGTESFHSSDLSRSMKEKKIDLILCCDLIYDEDVTELLIDTLNILADENPGVVILNILLERPFCGLFFHRLSDEGFTMYHVTENCYDTLGLENVNLDWICKGPLPEWAAATRKPPQKTQA